VQRGIAVIWRDLLDIVPNQVSSTMMYTAQFVEQRPDVARDFTGLRRWAESSI
jgi:hypothetical protein